MEWIHQRDWGEPAGGWSDGVMGGQLMNPGIPDSHDRPPSLVFVLSSARTFALASPPWSNGPSQASSLSKSPSSKPISMHTPPPPRSKSAPLSLAESLGLVLTPIHWQSFSDLLNRMHSPQSQVAGIQWVLNTQRQS